MAYTTSYYTSNSVLSEGRWVKISVSQTGIHQLSYDQLKSFGFENPAAVTVYGYGGASLTSNNFSSYAPDDLKETANIHTPDGRILFYGEADLSITATSRTLLAVRRNLYDRKGYYFLTDSKPSQFAENSKEAVAEYEPLTHHLSVSYVENDVQNPGNGGAIFHDKKFSADEECVYDFEINDFEWISEPLMFNQGYIGYDFAALGSSATALAPVYPEGFELTSIVNSSAPLQTQSTKFYIGASGHAFINEVPGDGVYSIKFKAKEGCAPTYLAMDKAYIIYPRKNRISESVPSIEMSIPYGTADYDVVSIATHSDDVRVWDITDAAAITSCARAYNETGDTLIADVPYLRRFATSARRLIAFDAKAAYPEAQFAAEVDNQNLHASPTPDMVIITTDELMGAAERLADLHRRMDGMDVKVVAQQAIFNEFSSGTRSAMAYRRFLKMYYDRDPQKIKYLIFYGHSYLDNRRETSREELVCYETEDANQCRDRTKNYVSDKYFAMLENGFNESKIYNGKMSICVGRIDVMSESEGDNINKKIEQYMTRPREAAIFHNILVMSDDGDDHGHFIDAEDMITVMDAQNQKMTYTRVHNVVYPWTNKVSLSGRKATRQALMAGQGMFLYAGHCSNIAFTAEQIYDIALINQTEYDDYPFAMLATCETFGFDRFSHLVGSAMHTKSNGGSIGVIGSCRSVYMEYNRTFAQAVAQAYGSASKNTTIGEILRTAHNNCITLNEADRAINSMCFNLCGDPALKVGAPDYDVIIESVNGINLADAEATVELAPLTATTIEGYIADGDNLVGSFNGDVLLRIYDTPIHTLTNDRSVSNSAHYPVVMDQDILAETKVKVIDGRFKAEIVLPTAQLGEDNNRLTASAMSDDKKTTASGLVKSFKISEDTGEIFDDQSAPHISEFYIDNSDFKNGEIIAKSAIARALIDVPASGLNVSTKIGEASLLMLDGTMSFTDYRITFNADGKAEFEAPLSNMTDGKHTLTLTVKSNLGNSESSTIDFVVMDRSVTANLTADCKVARNRVEFSLSHDFNDEPSGRLIIENANGETVFSTDDCQLPYVWDLKDNKGSDVVDGRYMVYAILSDAESFSATPKLEIVVIK